MIDANGTRHHLVLGRADWSERSVAEAGQHWFYDDAREALGLNPLVFRFPGTGEAGLTPEDRRGATRDRYGHWYWISADQQRIVVRWTAARSSALYWASDAPAPCPSVPTSAAFRPATPAPPPLPETLAGLAATSGYYLVAGAPDSGELLIFDLHTGGAPPERLKLPPPPGQPAETFSRPFVIVPLDDGGVAVLDRTHRCIWLLDDTLRLAGKPAGDSDTAQLFQPKTGAERLEPPSPAPQAIDIAACDDPIDLAPLPDRSFLVLDRREGASLIWRFWPDNLAPPQQVELVEADLRDDDEPPFDLPEIRGHAMALLSNSQGALTLYIGDTGGNQAFALRVLLEPTLTLRAQRDYYPLRSYSGKALLAPAGEPHPFYDQGERWLPIKAMPRPQFEREARLILHAFDGREPGCVWHRLCIDACIPPDSNVVVESRAADDLGDLAWQPWQTEPKLYRRHRGAEQPYYRLWSTEALRDPATGTWELLFQQAHGRYLDLRLTLRGNTRSTPYLRALRAYYPRFSYLQHYLPAVYREDPASARFLDNFLANPEGIFTTLEGQIAQVQALFDVRSAPADALDWLASWIGLALDPAWSDYQRRLLLAHAAYFYLRRGTRPGIVQAILLAIRPQLGPAIFQDQVETISSEVRIVERFQTRTSPAVLLGDPTGDEAASGDLLAEARRRAHSFTVLLPADTDAEQMRLVERIVNLEKPAHTRFTVKQYWAMFRVGEVRLGLDTALGRGGRFQALQLGETALAAGVLGAAYPFSLTDRTVIAQ